MSSHELTHEYLQSLIMDDIMYLLNRYQLTIDNLIDHSKLYESYCECSSSNEANCDDSLVGSSDSIVEFEASPNESSPINVETVTYKFETTSNKLWADIMDEEESLKSKKMYVSNRRSFRDALADGSKICPRYSDCDRDDCDRFHVRVEDLCTHAGKNNHCPVTTCDKIVIKGCRKGKHCMDDQCSFRH